MRCELVKLDPRHFAGPKKARCIMRFDNIPLQKCPGRHDHAAVIAEAEQLVDDLLQKAVETLLTAPLTCVRMYFGQLSGICENFTIDYSLDGSWVVHDLERSSLVPRIRYQDFAHTLDYFYYVTERACDFNSRFWPHYAFAVDQISISHGRRQVRIQWQLIHLCYYDLRAGRYKYARRIFMEIGPFITSNTSTLMYSFTGFVYRRRTFSFVDPDGVIIVMPDMIWHATNGDLETLLDKSLACSLDVIGDLP